MKKRVLLVGEYSGVFTELSRALKEYYSAEVFTVNDGDGYKRFPSDLHVDYSKFRQNFFSKVWFYVSYRLGLLRIFDFISKWGGIKKSLTGFDIVQIVNPVMFADWGSIPNLIILRYLKKHNEKIFLSVLGFDYYEIKYDRIHNNTSGIFTHRLKDFILPSHMWMYKYCLFYRVLNDYAVHISSKIIPGLYPYKMSYEWTGKTTQVIPFPIKDSQIGDPITIDANSPIIIFHGWQKGKEAYKGNDVFDRVIRRVIDTYKDKVDYKIVQNVPYEEYVRMYNSCHIFIDQLYYCDKGMNGALGMAKGKVVFSGFSNDALNAYPQYDGNVVGIHANNDEEYLYQKFCELIEFPHRIEEISRSAIDFVRNNHSSHLVAKMYINEWSN